MRGDRVLERIKMPLALRNGGTLAIVLHEFIQSAAADVGSIAREEQSREIADALFAVGFQGFHFVGLQRVQPFKRVLEAVNPDTVLFQVEISGGQYADFGGAQAVAVSEQEN